MDMLQTRGSQIVDSQGNPVYLRGVCIGGWMNLEGYINGYPGTEQGIRRAVAHACGEELAAHFFEELLDNFFNEADVAFLKSLGVTAIRIPLNYRHFESDAEPFRYLDTGFARLDRVIDWCARYGIYCIIELHSVQGWQNPDWHCDNPSRLTQFWQHPHFQDRFVALWQALADHYRTNSTIAGYNLMNEPVTNAPQGLVSYDYTPDWDALNALYRRTVQAIRAIDRDHIIFLEGDLFSLCFDGLEPPFADQLAYATHVYNAAAFGPGAYPGEIGGRWWDRARLRDTLLKRESMRFCQQHQVPLLIGECGSVYNGPPDEIPDRLRALDDQLTVFNEQGLHWTMWTYKDINVMGWVQLAEDCHYLQIVSPILNSLQRLSTDFWMTWKPATEASLLVKKLACLVEEVLDNPPVEPEANLRFMSQAVLSCYVTSLVQPRYAACFTGRSQQEISSVMRSFALSACKPHQRLIDIIRHHLES